MNIGGNDNQEVDLNLAPILDCFVVLIAFMLASAAFLAIGSLDAGIAAAGKKSTNKTPPPINITVSMKSNYTIELKVKGKQNNTFQFAAKNGSWNYPELSQQLENLRKRWPTVQAATLEANDKIEYSEIVRTMEMTRKSMPVVLLGGF